MKTPCPHHTPFSHKYYFNEKVEKMIMAEREQRQCPACLLWFFHGEFGKGWKKAIKVMDKPLTQSQEL